MAVNPDLLDHVALMNRFARLKTARGGRGRYLSRVAQQDLDRWQGDPASPLPSRAYALVSNWFLTEAEVDKESILGDLCGDFWDALFAVRPPKRMTPVDGNDSIQDLPFEVWWRKMLASGGAIP